MLHSQFTKENIKDAYIELKLEYLEEIINRAVEKVLNAKVQNRKEQPLTIKEVCETFKITKMTVYNWRQRGIIQGTKVGKNRYFLESEIKAALGTYGWEHKIKE